MGQRSAGTRTAGATERAEDMDRAPACNGSVVKRTFGALTVEDARHVARALLADAEEKSAPAAVPTVRMFAPAFLADCAGRWKPATRRAHADGVNRFIQPAFGDRRVDAIGAKNVRNRLDDLSATRAGTANRAWRCCRR